MKLKSLFFLIVVAFLSVLSITMKAAPAIGTWVGGTSTAFNVASNWQENIVPVSGASIVFSGTPSNDCYLDADRTVNAITNAQSTYKLVTNGYKLTINGSVTQTNGAKIDASSAGSTVQYSGSSAQTITSDFVSNKVYNLTINNAAGVTVNSDLQVDNVLTINASKKLTIPVNVQLNVVGTITNSAGATGLVIKADPNGVSPNGTLIFHNAAGATVNATVELYSKAGPGSTTAYKFRHQFFGVPVRSVEFSTWAGAAIVSSMNEAVVGTTGRWTRMYSGSTFTSFVGYDFTNYAPTVYSFQGTLENRDYNASHTKLSYTSTATFKGQHLIANPYTAAININDIVFGSSDINVMENTVYLFNTGSYGDYSANGNGNSYGSAAGQYLSVPYGAAGTNGLPAQIPSMGAVTVIANADDATAWMSFPYSSVVTKNADVLRAKASQRTSTRVEVKSVNTSDCMWVLINPNCSHAFDNGWDGFKILGPDSTLQLYAAETGGKQYQVNTVDDMNNMDFGFQANSDSVFTISFNHENMSGMYSSLYLIDMELKKAIDISNSGAKYTFVSKQMVGPTNRFKITTTPELYIVNGLTDPDNLQKVSVYSSEKAICVNNQTPIGGEITVYGINGELLKKALFEANQISKFSTDLAAGVYLANLKFNDGRFQTIKLVIN